ncbi:MAG: hypothetical protein AAF899_00265 [Pseudomonadota bacterium]
MRHFISRRGSPPDPDRPEVRMDIAYYGATGLGLLLYAAVMVTALL